MRDEEVFGNGDRQSVKPIDVQHHVDVRAPVSDVNDTVVAERHFHAQILDHNYLPVTRRNPHDRLNFTIDGVIAELRTVNVLSRHNTVQRGLNHLFGRRGNHAERKVVVVETLQEFEHQRDVLLQANALPDFVQVLLPDTAVLWIVQQQVGQLTSLLNHADLGQCHIL